MLQCALWRGLDARVAERSGGGRRWQVKIRCVPTLARPRRPLGRRMRVWEELPRISRISVRLFVGAGNTSAHVAEQRRG